MKIKPIIAVLTAPLVLLPAVAAAPTAEAAKPIPIEDALSVQINNVEYPASPVYPAGGKDTLTITTQTTGPVKAVCVAWQYVSGALWDDEIPKTFSESYLQKATKQKTGIWTFDLSYDLEDKYSAIRFSVAADDDSNCADTVTPTKRLSDKTAAVKVKKTINFVGQASLDLKASAATIRRGANVTFTATMATEDYPVWAAVTSGWLEQKVGSGPWEAVRKEYFFCPANWDCDFYPQEPVDDKIKTHVSATAQFRAAVQVQYRTAFKTQYIIIYSDPVTVTVK